MEVGFEYGTTDPAMITAWELNLFRFSAVKAAYQSAEVNQLFRQAKNFAEFEVNVRKLYGVTNKQHLLTEYNTAYQVGESSATYWRLVNQADTFPYWEYRTVNDGKVRPEHLTLHGKILPANHPLWAKLWPPNDWNCRCYVLPRLAGEVDLAKVQADIAFCENFVTNSPAWQKAEANGWGVNRAITQEVFTAPQMYSPNPDGVMTNVNNITASVWGLMSLAAIQAQASAIYEPNGPSSSIDYAGRQLLDILPGEGEVVTNPDEVYLVDHTWTYIKHYTDRSERITATLNSQGLLEPISSGSAIEADRVGLLIKS